MQPWLIQRIIREILPFVIDGVRAQMRSRSDAPPAAAPPPPAGEESGMRALRRQTEARLREMSEENEARFAAVQSQLRALEDRMVEAHADHSRRLERLSLYTRLLLGWAAALNAAVLYLLLR